MFTENIWEDEKTWKCYEGETPEETICIYRRCPKCGRFLKTGELHMNLNGDVKLKKWTCRKHGEVEPHMERI